MNILIQIFYKEKISCAYIFLWRHRTVICKHFDSHNLQGRDFFRIYFSFGDIEQFREKYIMHTYLY